VGVVGATALTMLIVPERAGLARVRLLVDFLAEQVGGIPEDRATGAGAC
jgi:hypothetical protein